jgi:hypothetical protein
MEKLNLKLNFSNRSEKETSEPIRYNNDLKFNIYILEEPDSTLVEKSKVLDF